METRRTATASFNEKIIKKWKPGMVVTLVYQSGLRRVFRVKRIPIEYKYLTRRIRQE